MIVIFLFYALFYGEFISLFSNSSPDGLRQPVLAYLLEDLSDMVIALGEKRSELCLSRLQALCSIDPDVLDEEWKLNWFPFSLNRLDEDDYEDDIDEDSLRIVNYGELAKMIRVSMSTNFSLVSPTEGSSFGSHSCIEYIIIILVRSFGSLMKEFKSQGTRVVLLHDVNESHQNAYRDFPNANHFCMTYLLKESN